MPPKLAESDPEFPIFPLDITDPKDKGDSGLSTVPSLGRADWLANQSVILIQGIVDRPLSPLGLLSDTGPMSPIAVRGQFW